MQAVCHIASYIQMQKTKSTYVHIYACQQREKKLLEGQVAQLKEQLVHIQAGFEVASKERDVLLADTVVSGYCPSVHSR